MGPENTPTMVNNVSDSDGAVGISDAEPELLQEPGPTEPTWRSMFQDPVGAIKRWGYRLGYRWRTSIQLRVIGSVFLSSLLVIIALGFVLVSFVNQQLLNAKFNSATEEINRARLTVEEQITATDTSNPLSVRLNSARAVLSDSSSSDGKASTTVYEPVIIASDTAGTNIVLPETATIPEGLRTFVEQGQVSYQYATMESNGVSYKTLVIGTPVASEVSGIELYLVMPLDGEENTLNLMRGLLVAGGIILLVLLVVIAWVFSQQLTIPVRNASRIAERFAAGHLRERMAVNGQDEVSRLSVSFNEMAESLSNQIRNLEDFGSLQRQFTSDVSHELRTPLTTVRMAADLIHDNAENLDPMTKRASELMNKELDRFELLLGDLLEISRHDAGEANLSSEKIDIRGVVHSALNQVRAIAEDIGTAFVIDMPEEPVVAEVDSRRVERVLRNLLANAVDHSEGKPITVRLAADGRDVSVTVTDQGIGLKPGEEEMVFNRFWRSDPSRERRTGGTGLGLAIAQEDAKLHNGLIDATGEPGVGSCFRLTLPLRAGTKAGKPTLPLAVGASNAAPEGVADSKEDTASEPVKGQSDPATQALRLSNQEQEKGEQR